MSYDMCKVIMLRYMLDNTIQRYQRTPQYSPEGEKIIRNAYQESMDVVYSVFGTHKRNLIAKVFAYLLCTCLEAMNCRFSSVLISRLLDVPDTELARQVRKGQHIYMSGVYCRKRQFGH